MHASADVVIVMRECDVLYTDVVGQEEESCGFCWNLFRLRADDMGLGRWGCAFEKESILLHGIFAMKFSVFQGGIMVMSVPSNFQLW
jgi:hypothetical protein